jgi:succinate dehydrogenase flavin-adding protein (antitoxin of CptAB toxin-antitoxin module)
MLQRSLSTRLMEDEEWDDVEKLGEKLDANCLKWLMDHTQSEEVYDEAVRAEREFCRLCRQQESRAVSAP